MGQGDWLAAAEVAFRAAAEGRSRAPPPMTLEGRGGAFHAKGAAIAHDGRLFVALKLNGNFPANPVLRGLPTIQGAILLCDGETGSLLAIMDSREVTLRRTAAASALAARHLAHPDSASLFLCGCGVQGAAHLAAFREVLPLRQVHAFDRAPDRARDFARENDAADLAVEAVADFEAARRCDVIVTCTTSTLAFLDRDSVGPGSFIAAVGADSPAKSEIAPDLMASALVVADRLDQCEVMGDLHHAVSAAAMTRADVHGELGELVTGRKAGRTSPEQITLFDSTGTGLQDAAAAALLYTRACRLEALPSIDLAAA
jgi:ornithine cyclodeaminase/alanine dehydrogenase-like protein (mu-crystallin family)